jgi:hypothetical protein
MKWFLLLICLVISSACQPLAVNSLTSMPGQELNPSFSTSTKGSATQVPSGQCPKEDPNFEFDVDKAWESTAPGEQNQHFAKYVLDFLNAGGTAQSILVAFERQNSEHIDTYFRADDITGDHVPEIIFSYGIWLDVFTCKGTKYELTFTDTYESELDGVIIIDVTDINRDGLAEVIVSFDGCMGNRCPTLRVQEWNGKDFQNLIANPTSGDGCSFLPVAPFEVKIQDIDNNNTKEIILSNNSNPWPDVDFPYRKETRICMWNGQNIVVYKSEFDAPYYRFQAVQDGDKATLAGDYNKALGFYQRTINDQELQWFTQDRKQHDFWVYHSKYFPSFQEPTPTASPSMLQDPNEYSNLAAYAYYRIMLLYILQNDIEKAESTFSTLQSNFPPGNPGNYFTQVASIFWLEYQPLMNVRASCLKVIGYAQTHPLPTEYLGDWDHGVQSIHYTPESLCPFK